MTIAVLCAALLHASWNAIAHSIKDRLIGFALLGFTALVLAAVAAPFLPVPAGPAWPLLIASAATHVGYNLFLMQSYRLGEFNQVYPLARGTSPWLVALIATFAVGEDLPTTHLIGVLVVSAGLASLVFAGGRPGRAELPALAAAVCTGIFIAGYTVLDGVGVRRSGTAAGYTAWLFLLDGLPVLIIAGLARGRDLISVGRTHLRDAAAAGILSVGAYGLVLWAQTRGQLASIAALREASIIFGAIIGAAFFHERFGRPRVIATVVVVAGIVLLNA
ncbi:MAG TPA: EamA family transporter [Mycobacteriales bacterium]|nr:EamA family transporter [Mycobacteriales bacterium]